MMAFMTEMMATMTEVIINHNYPFNGNSLYSYYFQQIHGKDPNQQVSLPILSDLPSLFVAFIFKNWSRICGFIFI